MIQNRIAAILLALAALPCLAQNGGLYDEAYRPQFHFSAQKNWLNDPNGLVYYAGEYHLYFQHNPSGIDWGNMTWGHAVSRDLVHWEQLANALAPDPLGTMFSGSAVIDWNNTAGFGKEAIVAIYTAAGGTSDASKGQPFTQCIAWSTDKGRTFTKYAQNPVLKHIVGGNRDPKVIWHEPTRQWIMALYLDKNDFALFSSPNLKEWKQIQTLTLRDCSECPDFFPLPVEGEKEKVKWVFTAANGRYLVGDFDGQKFTPDSPEPHRADWGKNYYAVQTYSDAPDGRRIQIAWMNGGKYPQMPFNQQMGFPCEMRLRRLGDGLRVCRTPVKEIETLHGREHTFKDLAPRVEEDPMARVAGDLFDIRADVETGDTGEFRLMIRGEPLVYSAKEKKITCLGASAPLSPDNGHVRLQILVDRSSIEIFANEGQAALSSCFVPKPENRTLEWSAGGATAKSLRIFELRSAWAK